MKWAAIKANMPGIRNSLNAGVYLILTAHNTSSDVRAAPEQHVTQRNRNNVSPESFCAKFLSGFNLVSEISRLIVEYFLAEEFSNKCCVICIIGIMLGPG